MEPEGIVNLVIYLRHSEAASGGRLSLLRTNIPTSMIHYEYYIKRISIKNRGEKRQKAEVLHRQDYKTHRAQLTISYKLPPSILDGVKQSVRIPTFIVG